MSALIVDWLGQGGIAATTAAWASVLRERGLGVAVVTRAGGELEADVVAGDGMSRVAAHAAIARAAAATVRAYAPSSVVVQNHILPPLESPLYRAVRASGAKLVVVVHDHKPHSPLESSRIGLRRHLRQADVLVCHSQFVARGVARFTGRTDVLVVPHPVQIEMVGARPVSVPRSVPPIGIHYGVLKRRYKGTDVVAQLARRAVPPWRFEILGIGAPKRIAGAHTEDRFMPRGELVDRVARATAALFPYRSATQSGAVVLAQALGTIPIATDVGGISEQIAHGETGYLLPKRSSVDRWVTLLCDLAEPGSAAAVGLSAQRVAWARHAEFVHMLPDIVSS